MGARHEEIPPEILRDVGDKPMSDMKTKVPKFHESDEVNSPRPSFLQYLIKEVPGFERLRTLMGQSKVLAGENEKTRTRGQKM